MSTFVLVHGSWHGGWCWHKVVARLEQAGHRVVAPDLPGLGIDNTAAAEVSLDLWNDALCQVLDDIGEPVILVGHSRGGLNISLAAESRTSQVARLVYLCAFVPNDGETTFDASARDEDSLISQYLRPDPEAGHMEFAPEGLVEVFYADCSADDVALARLCLKPEPLAPLSTPVRLTPGGYGSVPKVYIECIEDRAISIEMQRAMIEKSGFDQVISMSTSHSPFFSAADQLTEHLISLA